MQAALLASLLVLSSPDPGGDVLLLLFADSPPDATALGNIMHIIGWGVGILSCGALAVCACWALIVKIRQSNPEHDFVTKAELVQKLTKLETDLTREFSRMDVHIKEMVATNKERAKELEAQVKELSRLSEDRAKGLDVQIKELFNYTRQLAHDNNKNQHVVNLQIQYMKNIITQLGRKAEIPIGPEPSISREDEV